jgi:hypothetical protein
MQRRELLIKGGAAIAGLALAQNLPESVFAQNTPPQPLVGVIRWDGWFPNGHAVQNLQDSKYWDRLPFFAQKNGSKIIIDEKNIDVIRAENNFASEANLHYSFVYYHPGDWESAAYNYGFELYKNLITQEPSSKAPNYVLNLQGMHVGTPEKWDDFCNFVLENTLNDHYQKTQTGRPIINMLYVEDFYNRFGGVYGGKTALDHLRETLIKNNANPFIIAQNAVEKGTDVSAFDGVGAYTALGSPTGETPYIDLGKANLNYCNKALEHNKIVVPTVNAGWNPKPRLLDKDWGKYYSSNGPFYTFPTPDELKRNMDLTRKWLTENQTDVKEKIILIYAWNEFDEGGFICPTIDLATGKINRSRLDSIK